MEMYFLRLGIIFQFLFNNYITSNADPTAFQLERYLNETQISEKVTTLSGTPVELNQTSSLNDKLILNKFFMDSLTHLDRERIPERVVHAKGAGAYGYFEVTHDITHICKAELFNKIGKKTSVAVRFSTVSSSRGGIDTARDPRGFSVKFYTAEGNFDIVGLSQPMFFVKDPGLFPSFLHTQKPNPATDLFDFTARWDFRTLRAETLHGILNVLSNNGIFDGYRYMPGYSIHTYQVENEEGTPYFVRFHILPDVGNKTLTADEAKTLAGVDPDYSTRDLYNAIDDCNFPSWSLFVQILSLDEIKRLDYNPFDVTRIIPTEKYPLHPIGKIVLNRNADNYFKEIERLAFCPGNVVPGIIGAPDKLYEARVLSYRDAQYHRLGANYEKISPNCPFHQNTYTRDGVAPVRNNGGDSPNYYPNSFRGIEPYTVVNKNKLITIIESDTVANFNQASELYENLTEEQKLRLVSATLSEIKCTPKFIQDRVVSQFQNINKDLANRVAYGLAKNLDDVSCAKY